mmetsp:Transcript_10971/g.37336  ORF Transcript_10971/g.37336 Transcript_10971/m.37336 type:complete len:215 (-) Transcript_10971:892-1536(-)
MLQPRRTRCKVLSELRAPHLRRHQLPGMLWQRPAAARDRGRDRARIPHAARVARAVHGHGRGGTLLPQPHPRAQHAVPDGAQRVLSPRARGRMRLRGGQRWPVRRRALHAARPSPLRVGVHAGHAAAGQRALGPRRAGGVPQRHDGGAETTRTPGAHAHQADQRVARVRHARADLRGQGQATDAHHGARAGALHATHPHGPRSAHARGGARRRP